MPKTATKKPVVKKTAVKAKPVVKKRVAAKKPVEVKEATMESKTGKTVSLPVVNTDGQPSGHVSVPASLFGVKVNKILLAQAVRVYLANQRQGNASTKTRGEVEGSTRKIYRQKGTGRARHGAIRAPIFVGGGIVFGPQPRSFRLKLPKKMHDLALSSALTSQLNEGHIKVIEGLENLTPKTKVMAKTMSDVAGDKSILLIVPHEAKNVIRSTRNIEKVDVVTANMVSPYSVISHTAVIIDKNALGELPKTFKA